MYLHIVCLLKTIWKKLDWIAIEQVNSFYGSAHCRFYSYLNVTSNSRENSKIFSDLHAYQKSPIQLVIQSLYSAAWGAGWGLSRRTKFSPPPLRPRLWSRLALSISFFCFVFKYRRGRFADAYMQRNFWYIVSIVNVETLNEIRPLHWPCHCHWH